MKKKTKMEIEEEISSLESVKESLRILFGKKKTLLYPRIKETKKLVDARIKKLTEKIKKMK